MRRPLVARALARLLPADVRFELFEPALLDLYGDAARTGRGTSAATVLLFLECWRLAPAGIVHMLLHDIRHALRLLVREPAFTIAAVLTLALGVGANVAVFSVVNAALLRPLPYPDADRLMLLQHRDRRTGITKEFIAIGDFLDMRARQQSFETLAGYGTGRGTIYGEGDPFDVTILQGTPDLFDTLRARPALGRAFTAEDARPGAAPTIMLGHDVWQQRYAADPSIVGRSIKMGTTMRQVIGVAAPGFRFPANTTIDVILPMAIPLQPPAERKAGWVFAAARLKPGITPGQGCAELNALAARMEQQHPTQNQGSEYCALSLRDGMFGETRSALLLLLAAVVVVLSIACVNVANLLVARAAGRRQEMAVRVALGAARSRLVAQSLTESLVLASIAAATGVLFARWATPALVSMVPTSVNLPALATVNVDGTVLAFTAGVTVLTAIFFALISAFGIRLDNATAALVNPGRVTGGGAARSAASTLVMLEMAFAIVLLAGAGLVLRSFGRLLSVDPGFTTERVLTLDIVLPADRYTDPGARAGFYQRVFADLRQADGIETIGTATVMPLTGNNWTASLDRVDKPVPAGQRPPDVGWQAASGGYFETLKIPLRAGRLFNGNDRPDGPAVVIISEAVRDTFFPGEDPIGKKLRGGGPAGAEIVGVVGNIRRAALTDQPRADMYYASEQGPQNTTTLFIRTSGDPRSAIAPVRDRLRGLEPMIVIRNVQTLEEVARESVQTTRLAAWLLGLFAVSALALASVGIYGVMSCTVKQRTREIGVRLALGATPRGIVWLVMRDGIRVAGAGAVLGLFAGAASARALSAMLFNTSPTDPITLGGATVVLMVVAGAACAVPAVRATRVDPVRSLT